MLVSLHPARRVSPDRRGVHLRKFGVSERYRRTGGIAPDSVADPSRNRHPARAVVLTAVLAICALLGSCTDTAGHAIPNPASSSASSTASSSPTPTSSSTSPGTAAATAPVTAGPNEPTNPADDDPSTLPVLAEPERKPQTRTEELRLATALHGKPTLQDAIDIFDVTVDDLPGATPSALPDGDGFSLDES